MLRLVCRAALLIGLSSTAAHAQQRQQPPAREWRPEWAASLPYVPPAGHLGIAAFVAERRPCQIQLYFANATDTAIRDVWGTILVQPGAIPITFHARFIDPNFVRGVPTSSAGDPCPRNVERIEVREIGPCVRGTSYRRGCGAPLVAYLGRLTERRSDAVPVVIAPDFDR